MTLESMPNIDLVARVRGNVKFTPTERELAERLGEAIHEIELLTADLRAKTAGAVRRGADT